MTSKDEKIQALYDKIKNMTPFDFTGCECNLKMCSSCSLLINNKQLECKLFGKKEMDEIINIILGIHENHTYICNYLKFDGPFSKIRDTSKIVWSKQDYHIIFIDCGIRLIMIWLKLFSTAPHPILPYYHLTTNKCYWGIILLM